MEKIIVEDIIPIIVIMALGYVCGKFSYFDNDQRQGLNKVVLNIALPAALFVSIVKATREMLAQDIILTIIGFVGIIGMFMLSFLLCKVLFKHSTQEAAVCALIAGSPTIGFLGFAVLDPIYGNNVDTNLVIAIISIVVNAITIPIGMYLINVGQAKDAKKVALAAANTGTVHSADKGTTAVDVKSDGTTDVKTADGKKLAVTSADENKDPHAEVVAATANKKGAGKHHGIKNSNAAAFINAMKQPVCWAPLLAVILVLLGVRIPTEVDPTFDLIAKANSGVAVLAAGLALSTVKFSVNLEVIWNVFYRNILTPLVFLIIALICVKVGAGDQLSGDKIPMLIMSVALPPAFSGIIISSRYNIYVKEGASTVAVSTVVFAATCILWAWFTPLAMHMF